MNFDPYHEEGQGAVLAILLAILVSVIFSIVIVIHSIL
jgi:hypothetical protein